MIPLSPSFSPSPFLSQPSSTSSPDSSRPVVSPHVSLNLSSPSTCASGSSQHNSSTAPLPTSSSSTLTMIETPPFSTHDDHSSHFHSYPPPPPLYPNTNQDLWASYNTTPLALHVPQPENSCTTVTTASTVGLGRQYSMVNQCTTTYVYTNTSPVAPLPTYSTPFMSYRADAYESPTSITNGGCNPPQNHQIHVHQESTKPQIGYMHPSCYVMVDTPAYRNEQGACGLPTPNLTPEFVRTPSDSSSAVFF